MLKTGKAAALLCVILALITAVSCAQTTPQTGTADTTPATGGTADSARITSAVDADSNRQQITGDFSLVNADGSGTGVSSDGSVWTVTAAGTYTATGLLENGRIEVAAGEEDEVEIDLSGCSITSADSAAVAFLSCGDAKLKSVEGTYNSLSDTRAAKTEDAADSDTVTAQTAGGAVYARCDLKICGSGSLSVSGTYNNGIHTTKDLTVKNTVLKVTALNNALKGKDSVEIESGNVILISTGGDGIKTEDSDVSSKGNQRGTVEITGGNVNIYACCDGIDASYDVIVSGEANLTVMTDKYSDYTGQAATSGKTDFYIIVPTSLYSESYTYSAYFYNDKASGVWADASYDCMVSSGRTRYYGLLLAAPSGYSNVAFFRFSGAERSTSSYDAVSDENTVNASMNGFLISSVSSKKISGDWVTLTKSSDGSGTEYSCKGIKAANAITVSGGTVVISSTDDGMHANNDGTLENGSAPAGDITVSGGSVTVTSGDDGIHADNIVNIDGGTVNIVKSYEGIEGNVINFNGGSTYIYATDDGVNAKSGSGAPLINITGGYLDVTTAAGDTDGLDSNGNITVSGGFTLVKGGSSSGGMAGSIDIDGTITVTGGTVVALGGICELPSNSKICTVTMNGKTFGAGTYSVRSGDEELISFTLESGYSNGWICSDKFSQKGSYKILKDGSEFTSWTQSSVTTQNGSAVSGGMGGMGGGGMGGRTRW